MQFLASIVETIFPVEMFLIGEENVDIRINLHSLISWGDK